MRFYITANTSDWEPDVDYIIYFNGSLYDFDSDLDAQIAKLKQLIDEEIAQGKTNEIDFHECQVTRVVLYLDDEGYTDYDWDSEEVEYCADADDDYAAFVGVDDENYGEE